MIEHTPGTWISMDGTGTFGDGIIALSADDHLSPSIALPPNPPDGDNWTADSLLIAAAPDMHDALSLGVAMRVAQNRYFKDRSRTNLAASKAAEAAFDKAAKGALDKAGGAMQQGGLL